MNIVSRNNGTEKAWIFIGILDLLDVGLLILIHTYSYLFWLVVSTPLKNMNVNWDDEIPNIWKNKTCSSHHQPGIV